MSELRKIKGFENYEISSDGKIFRYGRQLKTFIRVGKCGYKQEYVNLSKNNIKYFRIVSRLVAFAFVDGYFEGAQCGHKDDNSLNNDYRNLYWTTPSENNIHNGRAKKVADLKKKNGDYKKHANYMKKKFSKSILQYSLDGKLIAEYPSIREAARQTGFDNSHIGRAAKGTYSQYNGYLWKYK